MNRLLHASPWVILGPNQWIHGASVLIESGRIAEVGDAEELGRRHAGVEQVDCSAMILMPGFLNCHNHMYEILCPGLGKNVALEGWLRDTIYPMARVLKEEDYY